jgi:ABC-type nitrate/sulfonate/bicarbonate transport system substrate-binding protein
MRRRELLAGALLAAGSACSRRRASSLDKLRVSAPRRLSASSFHLALERGYFREAGFDIEILQAVGPLNAIALLSGGKNDIHLGAINVAILSAIVKGLPIRIVAGREFASATCGDEGAIYGLRRTFPHGLASAAELKGKRVATGRAVGIVEFALDAQLAAAGLSIKDVTPVSLGFRQNTAALLSGGVDAMVATGDFEPDPVSLSPDLVRTPGLARIYPNFQTGYIFFGKTMLDASPERGARFLSAYLRGAREFARGSTPRFMEEFARAGGLDVHKVVTACRATFPLDGAIDRNSLRLFADWAAKRKYIPRAADVSELADDRFLRRIREG